MLEMKNKLIISLLSLRCLFLLMMRRKCSNETGKIKRAGSIALRSSNWIILFTYKKRSSSYLMTEMHFISHRDPNYKCISLSFFLQNPHHSSLFLISKSSWRKLLAIFKTFLMFTDSSDMKYFLQFGIKYQ